MDREIEFRGKRVDNEEWVYGYYVKLFNPKNKNVSHRIYTGYAELEIDTLYPDFYEIIPETSGQCTGLVDKNGTAIYEGDIFTSKEYPFQDEGKYNYHGIVEWYDDDAQFVYQLFLVNKKNRGVLHNKIETFSEGGESNFEVIGNIHD